MTADENRSLARELYGLFSEGQLAEASMLAAEGVRVDVVPFGMVFEGRSGFFEFMQGLTAFPDLTITLVHQVASADGVVSECSWTGTHLGELMTPSVVRVRCGRGEHGISDSRAPAWCDR